MLLQSRCAGCDRTGLPLCRTCRIALVGPVCGRRPVTGGAPGDRVLAAVPFSGRARDVLLGFKYRNSRQLAGHLAGLLVNRLLAAGVRPGVDVDVVTWAPTTRRRRCRRGFDQAELVARHVAAQLGLRCRRLLEREPAAGAHDGPQTGRSRTDRLTGPGFRVRPDARGRSVLVIDDVVTTGATLRSAADALADAGAVAVVRAAVAATPGGAAGRRERWGRVITGPWSADAAGSPTDASSAGLAPRRTA